MSKKIFGITLLCALVFASCESGPAVTRVDAATETDLSGYWNDTDVRLVCNSIAQACMSSPRLVPKKDGKLPVVIVGTFRNMSDEHIDTEIITERIESAILNSGKADFVASKSEREGLREERQDQQSWASEDTAKELAAEVGADYMLLGSIKTIVDKSGGTSVRTYQINFKLTDVESNITIFQDVNTDIKKIIKRQAATF